MMTFPMIHIATDSFFAMAAETVGTVFARVAVPVDGTVEPTVTLHRRLPAGSVVGENDYGFVVRREGFETLVALNLASVQDKKGFSVFEATAF